MSIANYTSKYVYKIVLFCIYVCMEHMIYITQRYSLRKYNINVHNKVHFVIVYIRIANYTLTVSNGWHPMTPAMPE